MTTQSISMSNARANFAETLESATNGEVVLIKRRGKPDAAIVDAEILEDYLAATNPRIIKKVQAARQENEVVSFEDAFTAIQ